MPELYEICRDKKDSANPRITNQNLAEAIGKSTNTVAQYLRGEAPNASFDTVVSICRELGISVDENSGIEIPEKANSEAEHLQLLVEQLTEKLSKTESVNAGLQADVSSMSSHMDTMRRSLRMHRIVTLILLTLLLLVLIALAIDMTSPNAGWIHADSRISVIYL